MVRTEREPLSELPRRATEAAWSLDKEAALTEFVWTRQCAPIEGSDVETLVYDVGPCFQELHAHHMVTFTGPSISSLTSVLLFLVIIRTSNETFTPLRREFVASTTSFWTRIRHIRRDYAPRLTFTVCSSIITCVFVLLTGLEFHLFSSGDHCFAWRNKL